MNKKLFSLLITGALLFITSTTAFAAGTNDGAYGQPCNNGSYGGSYGQNCFTSIIVKKQVKNPSTHNFVDNLSASTDPHYKAGQFVDFQIQITNNGNVPLTNVEVEDALPQYITLSKGFGKFDPNTKMLTLTVDKLDVNETKTFYVTVQVVDDAKIPGNGMVCVINHSQAQAQGNFSESNSQFCIEKKFVVQPAPKMVQTPPTGPEMLPLIGLIPAGLSGLLLRRKSNKKSFKGGEK
jgi:uncharacterized repeat protein (TIGR01451 family)